MISVKLELSFLLLCCCIIQGRSLEVELLGNISESNNITKLPKDVRDVQTFAQLLAAALEREPWSAAEQPCVRRLRRALKDADNFTLYAVWMLDALQLPSGQLFGSESHLGNYDECMRPRWRHSRPDLSTQYCLADVRLVASQPRTGYVPDPEHSAETYLKTRTYYDLDLGIMQWGLCLPAGCPKSAVTKIYSTLLRVSHLGPVADDAVINLKYCHVAGQNNKTYNGVKIVGVVLAILLAAAGCSTYYVNNYKLNPKSYVHEILRCFCLKRNYSSLTSVRDDEVYSVNVMRIFSSVVIVLIHNILILIPKQMTNGVQEVAENEYPYLADITVMVDTFFAISGVMMVRSFLGGKYTSPFKVVLKRYIRLIGVVSVLLLVKTVALIELGDGPVWESWTGVQQDICRRYYWLTFAMLQNQAGAHTHCIGSAWSTNVEFHLSVLAVMLCVIYRKNARLGVYIFSLVFLVLLSIPGYIQNKHSMPSTIFYGFESARDLRNNRNLYLYTHPHTRAGPFLVGMMMGWILLKYKPADYRKRISKEHVAAGSAVFTSLFRTMFAAAVCGVIALAEYGDLGILNSFFKWSPLVPLARLTYGLYLVNGVIAERNSSISRNSYYIDPFTIICDGLGLATISFFFSFVLYLLVEAPSMNIVSLLLNGLRGSKQDSTELNGTATAAETSSRSFEDKKIK